MKPSRFSLFVLICLLLISISSVADEWNLERVSKSVVFFRTPNLEKSIEKNEQIFDIGTGFLVDAVSVDNLRSALFLVTANHVAMTLNDNSDITFGTINDEILTIKLNDLYLFHCNQAGQPKKQDDAVPDDQVAC